MTSHSVNFAPPEWRERPSVDPRQSLLVTGALAVLLIVAALALGVDEAPVVEAQTPVPAIAPAATEIRLGAGEDTVNELWRARHYLPWHQFFADLSSYMGNDARIDRVSYDASAQTLDFSGEILEVGKLPAVMLRLDGLSWLTEPNPLSVELDDKTKRTQFRLRLRVVPILTVREERTDATP